MINLLFSALAWGSFYSDDPFKVAVTAGKEAQRGVMIAIEEMNDNPNIFRKIKQLNYNDEGYVAKGVMNAEKIVEEGTSLVIGHKESYISAPASSLYEFNGILMLNTSSTASSITDSSYRYIFRTIPGDEIIANSIAQSLKDSDLGEVLICYSDNSYGKSFVSSIEKSFNNYDIEISDRVSFSVGDEREFKRIIDRWKNYSYDSVLFIGYLEEAVKFIETEDLGAPIFCSEALASNRLIDELGDKAEGVVVPFLFSPKRSSFFTKYRDRFNSDPNFVAAISYDSVKLIERAMLSGAESNDEIANYLRNMSPYFGEANIYSFNSGGDVENGNVHMKIVQNGTFEDIRR